MHLLLSLRESPLDVRILWSSVFLRMASFGLTNQVLTLYLKSLEVSETNIGLFMTLTLIGDTLISYTLTWYADTIGRRTVMVLGTVMMCISGWIFSISSNYIILLLAAIIGVISPLGDETGPFKSVEEASIAHLTPHNHRPEVFAFHGLFATAGAALGSFVCGITVDYFHLQREWPLQLCYRLIFVMYSAIAFTKCILMLFLSPKCEVGYVDLETTTSSLLDTSDIHEEEDYGSIGNNKTLKSNPSITDIDNKSSSLSPTTRYYLPRLLIVFMLDSLGYGFMPSAWVVYYFKLAFAMSATGLGTLFFFTNAIDSISSLPSAYFAKTLGPVKLIIFTQAPLALFFILIAFTGNHIMASTLLILYCATSTMDVVPRQVLLTSIMPQEELTKVMGIVNIGKTFARCIGPVFTGKLASHEHLNIGFIINGGCVLAADLILGINFLSMDSDILAKTTTNILPEI